MGNDSLQRAFKALLKYNLEEQIAAAINSPEFPPMTPDEEAIAYFENVTGFRVDDEWNIWQGEYTIGTYEGVDLTPSRMLIKTSMYQAISVPLKRKTHEP